MSSVFLACLLLIFLAGVEAKEKQIKLEDIERDNLAAERHAKSAKQQSSIQGHQGHLHLNQQQISYQQGHNVPQGNYYLPNLVKTHSYQNHPIQHQRYQHYQQAQQIPVQKTPTSPRMQYGFVPLKSQTYQQYNQHQHQPVEQQSPQVQYQYVTPSHTHTQAYLPPITPGRHSSGNTQESLSPPRVQYAVHQPEETPPPSPSHQRYAVPIQTQAYQQYIQGQTGHTGHTGQTQIQYVPESQVQYYQQQPQPQPHQHPQIQYVVDNSIQQPDPQHTPQEEQKYYQQLVYLQPYQTPSASSNIHSVSDTKGNVQYVMYIPSGAAPAATYATDTVLAYPTNQETQYVYQPVLDESHVPNIPNESTVTTKSQGVVPHTQSPSNSGAAGLLQYDTIKGPKRFERPVFKHQPTSLLDSYVPSYLQYQYYKQQQAETVNAIKQSLKLSTSDVGKTDVVKTYKGETSNY